MNELKNNYRDLHYGALKVNADEFQNIKTEVTKAMSGKQRVKVS